MLFAFVLASCSASTSEVYGDPAISIHLSAALDRMRTALPYSHAVGEKPIDTARRILVLAGQIEQGIADQAEGGAGGHPVGDAPR